MLKKGKKIVWSTVYHASRVRIGRKKGCGLDLQNNQTVGLHLCRWALRLHKGNQEFHMSFQEHHRYNKFVYNLLVLYLSSVKPGYYINQQVFASASCLDKYLAQTNCSDNSCLVTLYSYHFIVFLCVIQCVCFRKWSRDRDKFCQHNPRLEEKIK